MIISKKRDFQLPMWDELPKDKLYNLELCNYINMILAPLKNKDLNLTSTMVQNYLKWRLLPNYGSRKYDREQLAWCLVITLYKRILPLKDVVAGIKLQQEFGSIAESYDWFATAVNKAWHEISHIVSQEGQGQIVFNMDANRLGLEFSAKAFVLNAWLDLIIAEGGIRRLNNIKTHK